MNEAQHDYERASLAGIEGDRPGPHRGVEAYTVIALVVAVVGGAIAFEEIDHWSQWVVLGGILATAIGFMIAVSPNREA